MAYQNINQYNFLKLYLKPLREISDISLTSDEKDYDEESIFSNYLIAEFDGNRMPLKFDFNSEETTICVGCGNFSADTIVSENYWNPNNLDFVNCSQLTEICDVGLTGIDNGLTQNFSGETIEINSGLYSTNGDKFNRFKYDRRFKMHPITGFTTEENRILNDDSYTYDLSYENEGGFVGGFARLNGGFYQGFYKLHGYDYEVLPERYNWGWSTEFLIRQRRFADFEVGLNKRYPENIGTFFFMGARAENKFYHFADGSVPYLKEINGTWSLYIEDFFSPDSGYIDSLTLTICDSNGCHDFQSNQTNIIINDNGLSDGTPASVYPVTFTVSGITGGLTDINLTLTNYYHTYGGDVAMLLVTPNGTPSIIAGSFGTGEIVDNINVTLSSSATTLWDEYSAGVFLNNSTSYVDLPFSPPCPYQFAEFETTKNLKELAKSYNRVTEGLDVLKTCECYSSTTSASTSCTTVYPQSALTDYHCTCACGCTCPTNNVTGDKDPLYDGVSNALSFRLSGESNPRLCVKTYRITGGCETTGSCSTTGITYTTGTSVTEWCSTRGIFDECKLTPYIDGENWVQIDAVFIRDKYLDDCDLEYRGGLKEIVKTEYIDSLNNNSVALVTPPYTHEEVYAPPTIDVVNITENWINQKDYRKGKLKFYVNGKLFFVVNDFEEIIPRPLNVEKEKQIGVSYNISLGGGTQGLHDNLTERPIPICDISYGVLVDLTLNALLSPGSINILYTLTSSAAIAQDITLSFTHLLGKIGGGNYTINTSVTIPSGETEGQTTEILDEDFNTLNGESSFQQIESSGISINDINLQENTIFPTPTPTSTPFQTPTPTNTGTPNPTPTNTSTPNITGTITPTPTITQTNTQTNTLTPTQTPTNTTTNTKTPTSTTTVTPTRTSTQTLTPTITPTQTNTPTNTRTPTVTPSFTPSNTVTPSFTPTNTETPTNTPTNTETPTPTPTPFCFSYTLTTGAELVLTYLYTDCYGNTVSDGLDSSSSPRDICAIYGSVSADPGITVNLNGLCPT